MVNIEIWKIYIGVIPDPFNETEVLSNHNNFYPKYGTQHACPHGYNTYMVVISMSCLATKEKNNLCNMHNKNI